MAEHQPLPLHTNLPRQRLRDLVPGIHLGVWPTGPANSFTDVPGVLVHTQEIFDPGRGVNTGVTTILPRHNWYESGSYAGLFRFNGAGDLTGSHFLQESGKVGSPIVLTNSLAVGAAYQGILEYVATNHGDPELGIGYFMVPIVGETFDGWLNNLAAFPVKPEHIAEGIRGATADPVREGNTGGGTGMICQGYKGGTGTSSRVVARATKTGGGSEDKRKASVSEDKRKASVSEDQKEKASASEDKKEKASASEDKKASAGEDQGYTVAALVQANFGSLRNLRIAGVPFGRIVAEERAAAAQPPVEADRAKEQRDGSIIVVLATDAPLNPLQCERLAKRATAGVVRTGGYGQNPSGDIFVAFSTANDVPIQKFARPPHGPPPMDPYKPLTHTVDVVNDESINGLFEAAVDATEEAIYNALCMAETMTGYHDHVIEALPLDKLKGVLDRYMVK